MRKNTDKKSGWEEIKNDFNRNYFFCLFAWLLICLLFSKPINQLLGKLGGFLFSPDSTPPKSNEWLLIILLISMYVVRFYFRKRITDFSLRILYLITPLALWVCLNLLFDLYPSIKFTKSTLFSPIPQIAILLAVWFVELLIIILNYFKAEKLPRENKSSFITDVAFDPKDKDIEQTERLGFENFANRIAEEIKTVSSKESVVFGINGEWGEGKTSMINLIRQQLEEENYTVVDFHPWKTNSGKAMNQLFFDALKEGLKNKIWGINWRIDRYADALLQLDKTGIGKVIWQFISRPDSVEKQKEKLAESMKLLDKNLVVVVDDLDRLAKNEIADVLKIMRDTANFPNLVFLAAYDRAYLNEAIKKEINEHNYENYMDKIVLWEAPIYRPQPRKYLEVLKNLLKEKLPEFVEDIEEIFDESSSRMTKATYDYSKQPENTQIKVETPYELHIALFTNLRTVKRFCNYLNFNIRTIKDKSIFADFYYLYLLRFFYSKQFDLFTTAYHELHRVKKGDFDEIERDFAKYTSIIFTNDDREKEKEMVAIVEAILRNVINNNSNTKFESLVYYKNFLNYFHLGNHNEITAAEFSAMLKADNIEEIKPKIDRISKDILNQFSNLSIIRVLGNNFPRNDAPSLVDYFKSIISMAIKYDRADFYKDCHETITSICCNKEYNIDIKTIQSEIYSFFNEDKIQKLLFLIIYDYKTKYEHNGKNHDNYYIDIEKSIKISQNNFINHVRDTEEITKKTIWLYYCSCQELDKFSTLIYNEKIIGLMKEVILKHPIKFLDLLIIKDLYSFRTSSYTEFANRFNDYLLPIFKDLEDFKDYLKNLIKMENDVKEKVEIYLKYADEAFTANDLSYQKAFYPNESDKNLFKDAYFIDEL
jgi:hypothetical protein